MKISLLSLAFFAGMVTGCVSPTSGIKSDPIMALGQLDRDRIQAQIGADAAALDRLYAEDFIGIGPSGTVRTKAQVIADFTSGGLRISVHHHRRGALARLWRHGGGDWPFNHDWARPRQSGST